MYVDNGKISGRQTFRLYVFDLMGIATLLLPPYLAKLCGIDGVFAILLGTGCGIIYLFYLGWVMKRMGTDIVTFLRENTRPWIRNIIFYIIIRHCVYTAGFCAYVFTNLMQYSLVSDHSYGLILFVVIAVSAYAVSGGIESRARVYEVLFWFVLIPFIAMMLASVRNFEWVYVENLFTSSAAGIGKGTYLVFLMMTPLFFSLFLIGEKEKNYGRNMVKTVAGAVLLAGGILLGSYILLVGNFGEKALGTMGFPVITLMSTIQFEGTFLKRMDAFMLAIWFFTLYALLNLHLHYAVKLIGEIFRKKSEDETAAEHQKTKAWHIIVPAVYCFFLASIMHSYAGGEELFFKYYSYVAVPIMVGGPGLLLFARRSRKS